jgi:hypothetical protein
MKRRPGLTLVEMMVSTALVLFIMVIISEAFVTGLESFHQLKSIGDMNEKLRSAVAILRRDLRADHFNDVTTPLSQVAYPPASGMGFFRIQGSASTREGGVSDPDGIYSLVATDHLLHFSINLSVPPASDPNFRVNGPENFLSALVNLPPPATPPPGAAALAARSPAAFLDGANYVGQWAEVAYFLRPLQIAPGQPLMTSGTPPQTRFALYRRQLVVLSAADATFMNTNTPLQAVSQVGPGGANWGPGFFYEVSCQPDMTTPTNLHFNSPSDLVLPARRALAYAPATYGTPQGTSYSNTPFPIPILPERGENIIVSTVQGADLLLTDVLSFDVQVFPDLANNPSSPPDWQDVAAMRPPSIVFDTGTPPTSPYKILGVKISLRIWDMKTQKTRQITITQDM